MPNYFYDSIKQTNEERQVEDIFNEAIRKAFIKSKSDIITNPYKCDGFIVSDNIKLLVEYKFDVNLKDSLNRAKVLIQVIFYLKKFHENGDTLPNVIMVADRNEVFVIHSNLLIKYLDEEVDWNISPSIAHNKYNDITRKIALDDEINPFVYNIDNSFNFNDIEKKIRNLANGVKILIKINEHNLSRSYNYFCENVIKDADKIPTNELVGIFIRRITDKDNCYKHPLKENTLVCSNNEYKIDSKAFDAFFSNFDKEYSVKEKKTLTEISDRLIEDTNRRRKGEFYTPTIFADQAHKMLSAEFGDDWKEKYVVWDCCWGTGNLTRDYKFKELYCSTLQQSDLDCGSRYNPGATKFQLDFLNDDILYPPLFGYKIPQNLYQALVEKKPFVFLINPPFATASSDFGSGKGKGACKTKVTTEMVKAGLSNASKNLFAQFLYNIVLIKKHFKLDNVVIGLFCNPIYLSGSAFEKFRKLFLKEFCYKEGILFNASCFADVKDSWGINFTVWCSGKTVNTNNFIHQVIHIKNDAPIPYDNKVIYNNDKEETAKDWIKQPIQHIKEEKIQKPTLSSGIVIKKNPTSNTVMFKSALGCYLNMANDVYCSTQKVALFSSCDNSNANGLSIMPENFERICAVFSARRLIENTWINHIDQYMIPDVGHTKYKEFINDAIIFSLFESKSHQSSLREVAFEDKLWDIKNEFFYISKNEIIELADKEGYDFTYTDAQSSQERFVYKKLQGITLSDEARDVLDYAIKLTKDTFKYRKEFNELRPEYQIMNWDCGWYQIKALVKEYIPEEMKIFSDKFKKLADKMRPMVYELGFLK